MSKTISGSCLCGEVRYETSAEPMVAGQCQCVDCRKSSGSGHCSHLGMAEEGFTVTGALSSYDKPADSGNIVTRKFCPTCGAAILSTNSGMPGMVFVRASSLDDPEVFQPQLAVYTSRAPSWDKLDPALPSIAEMPPPQL